MKRASVVIILGIGIVQGAGAASQPLSSIAVLTQSFEVGQQESAVRPNTELDSLPTLSSYKLSGELSLRPARISDDGAHMYLEWTEEQALPAVFAVNAQGKEEMVDGYMRQGIFTIDRVHSHLVFRIDKKRARADRTKR